MAFFSHAIISYREFECSERQRHPTMIPASVIKVLILYHRKSMDGIDPFLRENGSYMVGWCTLSLFFDMTAMLLPTTFLPYFSNTVGSLLGRSTCQSWLSGRFVSFLETTLC